MMSDQAQDIPTLQQPLQHEIIVTFPNWCGDRQDSLGDPKAHLSLLGGFPPV